MTRSLPLSDDLARKLALVLPAFLLGGAYLSQYGFGLLPCELCWWQRYPHFVALVLAALAWIAPRANLWVALAGLAIFASGVIGVFHAGVEYHWWNSPLGCTAIDPLALDFVRCDEAAWRWLGISLAGWNALFSTFGALTIWTLLLAREKAA